MRKHVAILMVVTIAALAGANSPCWAQQSVVVSRGVVASPWVSARPVVTYYGRAANRAPSACASVAPAGALPIPTVSLPAPTLAPWTNTWNTTTTYAYRPLVTVVRMPSTYVVGRGIIGQPVLYVPGQPVRNFLRWLGP